MLDTSPSASTSPLAFPARPSPPFVKNAQPYSRERKEATFSFWALRGRRKFASPFRLISPPSVADSDS